MTGPVDLLSVAVNRANARRIRGIEIVGERYSLEDAAFE
jgi:hypothetical protein